MKKISLLLLILSFNHICHAQAPSIEWQKTYGTSSGDVGTYAEQTNDGGYIMCGYSRCSGGSGSTSNTGDFYIIKTDAKENVVWEQCIGGLFHDQAWRVRQVADGGFIVIGDTLSIKYYALDTFIQTNIMVIKLNPDGDIEWKKSFGGSSFDFGNDIQQTFDGGYITVGSTGSIDGDAIGNTGNHCWVIKLSATGKLEWQKNYAGLNVAIGSSIRQTAFGEYIVAGSSSKGGPDSYYDIWVMKIDEIGTLVWEKTYGGSDNDGAKSLNETADEGIIVIGSTNSNDRDVTDNHGKYDFWLIKLNKEGELEWQKTFGGSDDDMANYIEITADENYVFTGRSKSKDGDVTNSHGLSDFWVLTVDSQGELLWQQSYGGTNEDYGNSVRKTSDNGLIVFGYSASKNGDVSGNHGLGDYWLVKLTYEAVATQDVWDNQIRLYPNPTSDIVNIVGGKVNPIEKIQLLDLSGRMVKDFERKTSELNVASLPRGTYIVQIQASQIRKQYKLIKN